MNNEPIYVTFEFRGNLAEEVDKVKLGIQGLRNESAGTYQRLIADSNEAFAAMSKGNQQLAISIQEDINSLRQLDAASKALDESFAHGTVTTFQYTEGKAKLAIQEADLRNGIQENIKVLQDSIEQERRAAGSIESKQQSLAKMEEAYRKLSAAERESAAGKEMLGKIKDLKQELSGLDSSYRQATASTQSFAETVQSVPGPIGQTATAIGKMTKAALAFIATPLGMVLAAIAAGLAAVSSWFHRTEEGENALAVATATFSQVLNSLLDVVDKVGEWLYKAFTSPKQALEDLVGFMEGQVINRLTAVGKAGEAVWKILKGNVNEGFADLANAQLQFATGIEDAGKKAVAWVEDVNEKTKESVALQERRNALDVKGREWLVERSNLEAKINELRDKAYDMGLPEAERSKALKEALKLTDELYATEKAIAAEKYDIIKTQNSLSNSNKADLLAEKEAQAEISRIEAQRYSARRFMLRQSNTIDKQLSKNTAQETANTLKAETALRLLEIADKQQAINAAEKESELMIRQNKIDLMDDSASKELEQLRLNHEKRLLEIRKAGEEQVKAQQDIERKKFEIENPNWKKEGKEFQPTTQSINQLPEKQKKYLEEMQKQANDLLDKSTSDYYKKELDAYMTYSEKRLELQKQYTRLREEAEASGNTARIENINREEKESLEKIDALFGEREASFQSWANGIVNLSLVQLGQLLEQAQSKLTYARAQAGKDGKLGENDDTARYRAQIIELQARIKELTANTKKDTEISFKDWKKVYEVLGTVNDELNEIGDNVGGATGEIIGMASDITTSTLSMVSSITALANWSVEATRLAAEGASKAIIAVERASVILAVISAAIQIISNITNALDGLKDAGRDHEEYMKLLISLQEEYNNKLVETQLLQKDVWGTDGIGNMIDAINALDMAMDNYNNKLSETQKAWKDPTGNFWKKLYQYGTIMGWVGMKPGQLMGIAEGGPGTAELRDNLRYITKKSSKGFLGIGGNHTKTMNLEEWVKDNIKNPDGTPANLFYEDGRLNLEIATSLVENNSDRLAGETEESLKALIKLEENIQAAEEAMRDYISDTFGSLGDGLSDAIVDAFQNGTDAAQTFRDNIIEVLEDVGRQMVRNLFVQKAVEAYEDELEKVYKNYAANKDDSTTTDEEIFNRELADATNNFFSGALSAIDQGNKFLEMYDAEMKKHGFDTYKPTAGEEAGRQAASKGIASMSQDSANELNGNFNALLIYADKTSTAVANINTLLVEGLAVMSRIAANTDRLENIEKDIRTMRSSMVDMLNKGLIMRKAS